ncbi:hypothetical protein LCGC14_0941600 [marine sediment metagenome]|uniref:Phosphoribosyltransferase domain-containing protein n=1 Tax=marine sediment metagenome TaxID=412755 RepID=A0A0F9NPI6_9ZZZZ
MSTQNTDYSHYSWFRSIFRPDELQQLVKRSITMLKAFHKETPFDAMAFTGMSGAMLAPILSYELQIPMIMVRTEHEASMCSKAPASGFTKFKSYIIVDDLVLSGNTLGHIHAAVCEFCECSLAPHDMQTYKPELVGVALYDSHFDGDTIDNYRSPIDKDLPVIQLWDETTASKAA